MNVALGIGDDEVVFGEELFDGKAKVAFDFEFFCLAEVDSKAQLKQERVGSEVRKDDLGEFSQRTTSGEHRRCRIRFSSDYRGK